MRCYIIADPADNSVTLSRRLFRHIRTTAAGGDAPRVFVFRIPGNDSFGFMLDPQCIDRPTQLCDIQYNHRHRCIGFETLCPSVGRILYDYGLPAHRKVRLSVSVRRTPQGKVYYQIDRPHEQSRR